MDDRDIVSLLQGDPLDVQLVPVEKHGGHFRLGCHLSPALLYRYCRLSEHLEEIYNLYCKRFEYKTVFGQIPLPYWHPERVSGREFFDRTSYGKMLAAFKPLMRESGGYVGRIDLKNFFGALSPELLLHILSNCRIEIEPTFVDEVTTLIQRINSSGGFSGLPQGYPVSHLIASIVLSSVDEQLVQWRVPYLRYVDDFYVFGHSAEEVKCLLEKIANLVELDLLLKINESKSAIEPPKRMNWITRGVWWSSIPIEEFFESDFDRESYVTDFLDEYEVDRLQTQFLPATDSVDWLRLYKSHFAPEKRRICESGFRLCMQKVAEISPSLIVNDSKAHALRGSSCIPHILKPLDGGDLIKASYSCYLSVRGNEACESSRLNAIEQLPTSARGHLANKYLGSKAAPKRRSIRQGLLGMACPNPITYSKVAASTYDRWIDERCVEVQYCLKDDSPDARRTVRKLRAQDPTCAQLLEMCSHN